MPSPAAADAVDMLVQFLLPHSVSTVQNAIIAALGEWLSKHFGEGASNPLKRAAADEFETIVGRVLTAKQYHRQPALPEGYGLPYPHSDEAIVTMFTQKVRAYLHEAPVETGITLLGTVNGVWMLTCPEIILRNVPEFVTAFRTRPAATDDDLIYLLEENLNLYLH